MVEESKIQTKKHIVSYEQTFAKYKKMSKEESDEKKKVIEGYEAFENELKEKAKIRNDF